MTNFERAMGRMNPPKPKAEPAPKPASDELGKLAASANRIDLVITVLALGVMLGTMITP